MALASPAEVQQRLFPDFACKGDELVVEFGEALVEAEGQTLPPGAASALQALDAWLTRCSGEAYADHYLDNDALDTSPLWIEIRVLAARVVEAMGWVYERPSPADSVYVRSPD